MKDKNKNIVRFFFYQETIHSSPYLDGLSTLICDLQQFFATFLRNVWKLTWLENDIVSIPSGIRRPMRNAVPMTGQCLAETTKILLRETSGGWRLLLSDVCEGSSISESHTAVRCPPLGSPVRGNCTEPQHHAADQRNDMPGTCK